MRKHRVRMLLSLFFLPAMLCTAVAARDAPPPPIIDMHLHAIPLPGPIPFRICPTPTKSLTWDPRESWLAALPRLANDAVCPVEALVAPESDSALFGRTAEIMERLNIIGVTSGPLTGEWFAASPDRIITGWHFLMGSLRPDSLRSLLQTGVTSVFAEVAIAYQGISPGDSVFEPYLAVAEELDAPVGVHLGAFYPGAPYFPGQEMFRAAGQTPLLLEPVLIRHPRLRVFVMHAGWPYLDDMIALLATYPQVHVDIAVLGWVSPAQSSITT